MPHQRNERTEKELGDRDCVSSWCVDDGDAERGGFCDVDVVGADACADDDLEATRAAEVLARDLGGAASDDGVVVADDVEELAPGDCGSLVDDEAGLGAEEGYAFGVDVVGD